MTLSTIRNNPAKQKKVKTKKQKAIAATCAVAFWLLVWHAVSLCVGSELVLVSPVKVVQTLFTVIFDPDFLKTVWYSAARILGGFFTALTLGTVLGWVASRFWVVETLLRPITAVIKATPVASFIILVLLWFSGKNLSVIISMLMVFPVIYMNVLEGIRSADKKLLEMAQVFRLSVGKKLLYIYLPAVAPFFVSACSVSLGLCWKSGIAAEVIGTPGGSIGAVFYQAKIFLQTSELLAWTVVVVAVSVAFEKLFMFLLRLVLKKLKMEDVLNGKRA